MNKMIPLDSFFRMAYGKYRLSKRTLQWYVEEGLLPKPQRDDNDARIKYYPDKEETLAYLQVIVCLKPFISLPEIRDILVKHKKQITQLAGLMGGFDEYLPNEQNNYEGYRGGRGITYKDIMRDFIRHLKTAPDLSKASLLNIEQSYKIAPKKIIISWNDFVKAVEDDSNFF